MPTITGTIMPTITIMATQTLAAAIPCVSVTPVWSAGQGGVSYFTSTVSVASPAT